MDVFKKIKWVLGVLLIFFIILATNLIDKRNFQKVEEVVENIYEKRLKSKELLLDITLLFHEKELAYALNDSIYIEEKNEAVNDQIAEKLEDFENSAESRDEKNALTKLKSNYKDLKAIEQNTSSDDLLYSDQCAAKFSDINESLKEMSDVQVEEGRIQKLIGREAVDSAKLFAKIEVYLLIFLALVIQVIILYNPKKKPHQSAEG